MLSRLALSTGRSVRAPVAAHVRRFSLAPTRARSAAAVKREVSSFQHPDGRTSLLKHITGGGALGESTGGMKAVYHAVSQPELWPLLISIGFAVVLCAYKVGRMNTFNPDTMWNKADRMATLQDPERLAKEGKAFVAHKEGKVVADFQDIKNLTLLGFQPKMKR